MNTENEDAEIRTERIAEDRRDITYDPAGVELSTVVVEAVARLTETRETDLEPLANVVDPEALDAMCERAAENGDSRASSSDSSTVLQVTFEYEGCYVVTKPGQVIVRRGRENPEPAG